METINKQPTATEIEMLVAETKRLFIQTICNDFIAFCESPENQFKKLKVKLDDFGDQIWRKYLVPLKSAQLNGQTLNNPLLDHLYMELPFYLSEFEEGYQWKALIESTIPKLQIKFGVDHYETTFEPQWLTEKSTDAWMTLLAKFMVIHELVEKGAFFRNQVFIDGLKALGATPLCNKIENLSPPPTPERLSRETENPPIIAQLIRLEIISKQGLFEDKTDQARYYSETLQLKKNKSGYSAHLYALLKAGAPLYGKSQDHVLDCFNKYVAQYLPPAMREKARENIEKGTDENE
ncbi:hypothetical protein [Persicobacter psychrovividus]|uniref:Uncharacterized protein n=1 Tax=Persicobacter psychrovividus TaxID=387638 RepID=A0ABN6L6N2_9BACT|nr:hypothetical protein PEPS_11260 [Persicobacter psychrovividus]